WEKTRGNDGMTLVVAVNYGSREEILHAVRTLAAKGPDAPIDEEAFSSALYTAGMPDPELLIRTSGEMRVSNFLLWQIAYTEFYCTDVLWPDFNRYEFLRALLAYQARDRRFGAV
ncbi:MAG: di-trans,poly-cis-decaprenylcistransferase, partial [Eggerthellaceae bacterium]|nr:di-trans,poly-cis-decaprenylcistransferase [Eggerthellaceae bacterium]